MPRQTPFQLVGLLAALPIFAACGTDTLVDVAAETAALVTAECDAQASGVAVGACFATFRACKAAEGAVEADCRTALDACLPEGLPERARHGGGCHADGGRPEGGPPPRGERPEGGPLGGLFGPPPDADGGMRGPGGPGGHGGPGRPGGHRGHGGPRGSIGLDDAAVQACRATAEACVAGGGDEQTCRDTARTCIHDAFTAAFAARCEELTAACAANPGTNCDEITARCANGLGAPDAGTCQAP